jgi:cysteine synthase A
MGCDIDRRDIRKRAWISQAISLVEADANRSADTHLLRIPLPPEWNVHIYLKDESTHPTGSLKHRLARSLFLYALCNGWIDRDTTIIDASSGSTAISEAYFAALLGLKFIAVVPRSTAAKKVMLIQREGGECHFVEEPTLIYETAALLASKLRGCYLDQFTYSERAIDWRGNNNIAESIFQQMEQERHPIPTWIVVGAGTGGTSATIGRYIRYKKLSTSLAVVDPEGSAFFPGWRDHCSSVTTGITSRIEGIGRPRVEPSFIPAVVDRMIQVPDAASVAAAHLLERRLGRRVGASTGTNLWGAMRLACEMQDVGIGGSLVTLLCDSGVRYEDTYYSEEWLAAHGIEHRPYEEFLELVFTSAKWDTTVAPTPDASPRL